MIFSRPLLLKVWSRDQQAQASSETLLDILAPIPGFLNWNLCLSSTLRWFPCNLGFLGFWGHFLFTSCSFYFSQVAHQPPSDSQLSRLGKTKCDTTTLSVTNWKETIPSDSLSLWDFLRGGVGVEVRHTFTQSLLRIPVLDSRRRSGAPSSLPHRWRTKSWESRERTSC